MRRADVRCDRSAIRFGAIRRFLTVLGAVASAFLPIAAAPAGAHANSSAQPTSSAAAFRDSVGVVVHVSYFDTPYDQWSRVVAKLRELGVTRIRDGLFASANPDWNTAVYDRLNAAVLNGLRLNLVVPIRCSSQGTVEPCLSAVKSRLVVKAVDSLEWPNEYDVSGDPNWAANLRAWGRELSYRVKVDPALGSIDVIGPSLVHPGSRAVLGDQSDALDFGNAHPFTGATSPNPLRIFEEYLLASQVSGAKPIVATEAGFHTATNATNDDQPAADEATAAVYTLRTVLEHYADNIRATYLYELLDERNDPVDSQSNYGLLHTDFSPKPAFTALRYLLAMVGNGGPSVVTPLAYGIAGDTSDLRQVVLERADGSHLLILWRTASVWDPETRRRLPVEDKRYSIWVPGIRSYAAGDPVVSPFFVPGTLQGGLIDALVGADPLVLEIRRD